jgi:hypothetical protein
VRHQWLRDGTLAEVVEFVGTGIVGHVGRSSRDK